MHSLCIQSYDNKVQLCCTSLWACLVVVHHSSIYILLSSQTMVQDSRCARQVTNTKAQPSLLWSVNDSSGGTAAGNSVGPMNMSYHTHNTYQVCVAFTLNRSFYQTI